MWWKKISKKKRAQLVGFAFIIIGIPGLILPFLQGFLFILIGLSILSVYSKRVKKWLIYLESRRPKLGFFFLKAEEYVERVFGKPSHTLHKEFIENKSGKKIAVLLEKADEERGLAFVMHGLGGFKEQLHIERVAAAFRLKGFTVVRFDARHTFGESEGDFSNATTTSYLEDLTDVITWAKEKPWFEKPFALAGHSTGSMCVGVYAQNHPDDVSHLVLFGSEVSGRLTLDEYFDQEALRQWREEGVMYKESSSNPEKGGYLKWREFEADLLKYSLFEKVERLSMPLLIINGENDPFETHGHGRKLFDIVSSRQKRYVVISNAPHTFREERHLEELTQAICKWLRLTM